MIPSLIYLQNILSATVQFNISCCFAVSPFHFVFAQFQVTVKAVKKKIKSHWLQQTDPTESACLSESLPALWSHLMQGGKRNNLNKLYYADPLLISIRSAYISAQ